MKYHFLYTKESYCVYRVSFTFTYILINILKIHTHTHAHTHIYVCSLVNLEAIKQEKKLFSSLLSAHA